MENGRLQTIDDKLRSAIRTSFDGSGNCQQAIARAGVADNTIQPALRSIFCGSQKSGGSQSLAALFNRTGDPRPLHHRRISLAADCGIGETVFGFDGIARDGPAQFRFPADFRRQLEITGIKQYGGTSLGEAFVNVIFVPRCRNDEKRTALVCIEPCIGHQQSVAS
ncbi:hypothetical protein WJ45_25545 [Burkholderia ubonensis]|nr:hypothetical protein WJ45_25545 [Burkholderia ubonensis]KVQ47814.1 hypothetical protein WK04_10250 [Burkholderia ubonensis]